MVTGEDMTGWISHYSDAYLSHLESLPGGDGV